MRDLIPLTSLLGSGIGTAGQTPSLSETSEQSSAEAAAEEETIKPGTAYIGDFYKGFKHGSGTEYVPSVWPSLCFRFF